MPSETPRTTERFTSKALLYTNDGEIICVTGERDIMFNLAGGGIDRDETPIDALYRELNEELGITPDDMTIPREIGGTWAEVPNSKGEVKRAIWHVHEATLLIPSGALRPSAEVKRVGIFSPETLLAHDSMSILAKQALALKLGAINIDTASLNL